MSNEYVYGSMTGDYVTLKFVAYFFKPGRDGSLINILPAEDDSTVYGTHLKIGGTETQALREAFEAARVLGRKEHSRGPLKIRLKCVPLDFKIPFYGRSVWYELPSGTPHNLSAEYKEALRYLSETPFIDEQGVLL